MAAADLVTHTPEEISRIEADTGLLYSGYMQTGDPNNTLIPVLLRPIYTAEERKAKVLKLNRGI